MEPGSKADVPDHQGGIRTAPKAREQGGWSHRLLVGPPFRTVPMSSIVANVNLDMVGRNDPGQVIGVGQEYTSIGALADSVAEHTGALGLDVIPDPAPDENLYFRSDQLVFACRDIPALFFTSGLHEDYHSVRDEVEDLDTDKIARVAQLSFYLVSELADAADAPTWTAAGLAALSENTRCP